MEFEPKIIAMVCTYCTYTAADMAGSLRLQYPHNVRIVKYLCTGKVDIQHILKAFEGGADALLVGGWEIGDCHFLEGNLRAKERVEYTKILLQEIGLEPERLEMFHIGASDAPAWARAVTEMTERARRLGPNRLKKEIKTIQSAKWKMQKRKGNHNKMPDGSSQEKNTYQRNLVAQIQEGVKDADEGRLITTDKLLARVEKWEL